MNAMTFSVRVKLPDEIRIDDQDVDQVVATLKRELSWGLLRRKLLAKKLDGRTALALANIAIGLQNDPAKRTQSSQPANLLCRPSSGRPRVSMEPVHGSGAGVYRYRCRRSVNTPSPSASREAEVEPTGFTQ